MKQHNKLTTPGGFRLIRAFSVDDNVRRLRHYVDRLERQPDMRRWLRRMRLRRRFSTRLQAAAASRAA